MKRKAVLGQTSFVIVTLAAILGINACASSQPGQSSPLEASATAANSPFPSAAAQAADRPQEEQSADIPCIPPAEPAPQLTEGPYFKSGSPERTSLIEAGTAGERLVLSGYVLTTDCQPIANAMLDFWQADGNGAYDNAGFRLRGHVFADATGHYELITVVPGLYPGRTEHIHVKVQPPGGELLTTQLFFPDVEANQGDRIFDDRLLINMQPAPDGWLGSFNFIVNEP